MAEVRFSLLVCSADLQKRGSRFFHTKPSEIARLAFELTRFVRTLGGHVAHRRTAGPPQLAELRRYESPAATHVPGGQRNPVHWQAPVVEAWSDLWTKPTVLEKGKAFAAGTFSAVSLKPQNKFFGVRGPPSPRVTPRTRPVLDGEIRLWIASGALHAYERHVSEG